MNVVQLNNSGTPTKTSKGGSSGGASNANQVAYTSASAQNLSLVNVEQALDYIISQVDGCKIKVSISTNQDDQSVLNNVMIEFNTQAKSYYAKNGKVIEIPYNTIVTIVFPEVEGYRKPNDITFNTEELLVKEFTGMYEQEIVDITVNNADGLSVSGLTLYINDNPIILDESGKANARFAYGTKVTLTTSPYGEYVAPSTSFTTGQKRREVLLTYRTQAIGVFIADIHGKLHTPDAWDSANNDMALGVYVGTETHSFVIAKKDASASSLQWGGYKKELTNIPVISSKDNALLDFDGAGNTPKIMAELAGYNDTYATGAPAAEACANFIFPNGKNGYLPALGEWNLAYANKTAIADAMTKCGGTAIKSGSYWSSTQYSANDGWSLSWGNGYIYGSTKDNGHYVRAFCAF